MEQLKLVKPCVELKEEYLEMLEDWKRTGEDLVPWVLRFDTSDFSDMVRKLEDYSKGVGLPEGKVEHSTYWLINSGRSVLGAVNIRHRLNDYLLNAGGHIGYGIRPSERRKGYAAELLRQSLTIAKFMGLNRVLLVCDEDNIGSERAIIKNGGIFESTFMDGNIVKRFWINLD